MGSDGQDLPSPVVAELAYGFQESVVHVLSTKTLRAAEDVGARTIVVGGGVAANSVLRSRIEHGAKERAIRVVVPRPGLCTDNAAMIGAAGFFRARAGERGGVDLAARPSLKLAV
jgi:N6-L-threonylcarbamoyladenine synthase